MNQEIELTASKQAFILHFGEMGSRWGINRTIGQMYALMIINKEPVNADQLSSTLKVSRSNVSMGLKELQAWNLIRHQHIPGDRKDYFTAPDDTLEIALTLLEERRKREIDPTLSFLRDMLIEEVSAEDKYAKGRMQEIHDLIESVVGWSEEIQDLSKDNLKQLMKLGSGVGKLLGIKDKLLGKKPKKK